MTKEIELPSGRHLLVKVPKDQSYFDLYGGNTPNSIEYNAMPKPGKFKRESIKLPEGHTFTLIGKADQLTEDQWCRIFPEVIYEKQHGLWWVKNNGFEIDTTLILKID